MCLVLENLDLVKSQQTESMRLGATVPGVRFRLEVLPTSSPGCLGRSKVI